LALAIRSIEREVVLKVDFDLLHDDGCAWVSARFHRGPQLPGPGDVVYLMDHERRGCVGRVEDRDGWYLCIRPDWSTWTGGELPEAARSSLSR
jgi:hypothetical protein